jgi:hypothetical protein
MRVRAWAVRGLALLVSLVLFLGTGELALRVLYRDAGARTLGGPGGRSFEHLTIGPDELRGRRDAGPRRDGVPRLMVLGDSITYGQGVRDWRDTWPEVLATTLDSEGRPHEMAVFALPGRDMPAHLEELERRGPSVQPDVLIYQWYVNDIEVISHRPDRTQPWQRWGGHEWLRRTSYLYYFLNHRAMELLPSPERSYADYITQDFVPGSVEWAEFERYFHAFSIEAAAFAGRRVMVLYPQVPFRDGYPLQTLHDRMKAMADPHELSIPPPAWVRLAGQLGPDAQAPWGQSLRAAAGQTGPLVETQEYLLDPGEATLTIAAALAATGGGAPVRVGTLDLVDARSNELLASAPLTLGTPAGAFERLTLPLTVTGGRIRRTRMRVHTTGAAGWTLGDIAVAVRYGWEVIDLAEPLNRFNTHASAFDAHPNEAAHRAIAAAVHQRLVEGR